MRSFHWVAPLLLLSAGCVAPFDGLVPDRLRPAIFVERAAGDWSFDVEPAMAPDFAGMGETYPVLVIHSHHVPSARQREAMKDIVCLALDGSAIERARAGAREMAACAGPVADAPTGRVFVDRKEFEEHDPLALAVRGDSCGGGVVYITEARRSFQVSSPAHAFVVRFEENGTFSVDGRWIAPGTSLKVGYFIARGSAQDEEYVRVAFEAPGEWLRSRVGVAGEDMDETVPSRPTRGSGLAIDVPLSPETFVEPVARAVAASPRPVHGVEALRVVHDGERITELTLRLATAGAPVTWYGAGRTGDALRLFAAEEAGAASNESAVDVDAFLRAFDVPFDGLRRPGASTLDVRLAPEVSWSTAGVLALAWPAEVAPCGDGCVRVWQEGEWRPLVAPHPSPAAGALTLRTFAFDGGDRAEAWWHVARGSVPPQQG